MGISTLNLFLLLQTHRFSNTWNNHFLLFAKKKIHRETSLLLQQHTNPISQMRVSFEFSYFAPSQVLSRPSLFGCWLMMMPMHAWDRHEEEGSKRFSIWSPPLVRLRRNSHTIFENCEYYLRHISPFVVVDVLHIAIHFRTLVHAFEEM